MGMILEEGFEARSVYVRCEMSFRYSNGDIKLAVQYRSLKSREEFWAGGTHWDSPVTRWQLKLCCWTRPMKQQLGKRSSPGRSPEKLQCSEVGCWGRTSKQRWEGTSWVAGTSKWVWCSQDTWRQCFRRRVVRCFGIWSIEILSWAFKNSPIFAI